MKVRNFAIECGQCTDECTFCTATKPSIAVL